MNMMFRAAMMIIAIFSSTAAYAQTADTVIWYGSFLDAVLAALAVPVAGVLTAVLWKLAKRFGVEVSEKDQAKLNEEAKIALNMAVVKASEVIRAKGWDHVDVKNRILADAAEFFLQRFPDRSQQIAKVAGADTKIQKFAAVEESLMARLPAAAAEAAASPATPPNTLVAAPPSF